VRKEDESTHIDPHNAVFCVLGRDTPLTTASVEATWRTGFGTCRERTNSTNTCVEIVFILSDIPTTALMAASCCRREELLLLFERNSSTLARHTCVCVMHTNKIKEVI